MKKNFFWVASSQLSKIISQAAGLYCYSRFLGPESLGVMAIATAIINFSNIFKDFGTSAAIIQKEKIDNLFLSTIYWINLLNGVLIFLLMYAISGFAASFFGMPELSGVIKFLSFIFPIVSVSLVKQALLERAMNFKIIAIAETISSYSGVFFGCLFAYYGYGVKSIAIQSIISAFLLSAIYIFSEKWRPAFVLNFKTIYGVNSFSGNYTAFTVVNYCYRNVDIFIVGKFMGDFYAGLYSQASKLMMIPLQLLSSVANRVLFPVLSREIKNDYIFREKYKASTGLLAFFSAYVVLVFVVDSKHLIELIFGKRWEGVADLVVYMFPAGFIQSVISTTGSVLMAKGRTDIQFKLGLVGAVIMLSSFAVGVFFDLDTMVKAYLAATIVNSIPCFYVTSKLIKGGVMFFPGIIIPPSIMCFSAYFLACFTENFFCNGDIRLKFIISTTIYWVCFFGYKKYINFFYPGDFIGSSEKA